MNVITQFYSNFKNISWRSDLFILYESLKVDRPIYIFIAIYIMAVFIFSNVNGYESKIQLTSYMEILPIVISISLCVSSIGYLFLLVIRLEKRPLFCFWIKLIKIYELRNRIITSFFLLTAISAFTSCFSTVKALIPLLNPFSFDELFHRLDLFLFSGVEPWKIAHGLFQSPWITLGLNILYNFWLICVWGVLCLFLVYPTSKLRLQYLMSWLLSWSLLGNALAYFLPSAGPAFVSLLEPLNTTYEPLMSLLHAHDAWLIEHGSWVSLWALSTQDALWESYSTGKEMLGSGISAMPSMHVSMAVLMALGVYSINKMLGWVFWIYAVIIYIGSFMLGWHYAVDGLVSAPLTYVIWRLCGYCLRHFDLGDN